MADIKATENKTGTLFYTKIREGTPSFRVRFRSFQQVLLENKEIKEELSQMEVNYNYFKYGRSQTRKQSLQQAAPRSVPKLYKNMRDRNKDSEQLRIRLKSMRETRRSIFQRIKSLKE